MSGTLPACRRLPTSFVKSWLRAFDERRIQPWLLDGTVVGRALIQFGDTADGCTSNLTVYFPVTCPDEVLDHHLRHYAVEFRNWIVAAAAARA